MKHDLKHVTFNIPVKIDSVERLENLQVVVNYILHHFDTNIIVYEAYVDAPVVKGLNPQVLYIAEHIGAGPFHRTKYLNQMALISRTPVIVNYDCDVLFTPENYIKAANTVNEKVPFCFPYDGLFLNISRNFIPHIKQSADLSIIDPNKTENFGRNSMGGAIFWNRIAFMRGGMENENFISWGYEDWERVNRFEKFGAKILRIPGPLYHISHPRGKDSSDGNPHYQHNGIEYNRVTRMNSGELFDYVRTSPWMTNITWA